MKRLNLIPWNRDEHPTSEDVNKLNPGDAYACPPYLLRVNQKTEGKVFIPPVISGLYSCAFLGCCWITEISGMRYIFDIMDSAFRGCYNLKKIDTHKMNAGFIAVGDRAFSALWEMEELYVPDGVKRLHGGVFARCHIKRISMPSRFKRAIERKMFAGLIGTQVTFRD